MNDRHQINQEFAKRLYLALVNKGFCSQRSTAGVDIKKLAEITGYSLQICRKYLRGQAFPEPSKLMEIASKLDVSAGWLLFGDLSENTADKQNIIISKSLLNYLFLKSLSIKKTAPLETISNLLCQLAHEFSGVEINEEKAKNIIDLALLSVITPPQTA